jgi:hypothetical protein
MRRRYRAASGSERDKRARCVIRVHQAMRRRYRAASGSERNQDATFLSSRKCRLSVSGRRLFVPLATARGSVPAA